MFTAGTKLTQSLVWVVVLDLKILQLHHFIHLGSQLFFQGYDVLTQLAGHLSFMPTLEHRRLDQLFERGLLVLGLISAIPMLCASAGRGVNNAHAVLLGIPVLPTFTAGAERL